MVVITAAADGSALGNPGPAGWAWYVDDDHWDAGGWPHGTNNQGELQAVLELFRATAQLDDAELRVLCDSQYVINAVTTWMAGWKRRGWRKADGSPVMNVELLRAIDEAIQGRRFRFEWVKGHAGHSLNEAADLRARAVATAYQNGTEIPTGPGWGARTAGAAGPDAGADPRHPGRPRILADEPGDGRAVETQAPAQRIVDDGARVLELEERLLDPGARRDRDQVDSLLHPDFEEFGASGRIRSRAAMLDAIGEDLDPVPRFRVLGLQHISPTTLLVTFTTESERGTILRSSLWVKDATGWRLRFRQGTPMATQSADPAAAGEARRPGTAPPQYQASFDF